MYESVTLRVECEESDERYGRFVAEPLERGFGATLGNALRRVLLNSLSGSAVTWVKIDGIQHEFSTVPSMKEDTIEFLLNVKAIRIRRQSQAEGRMFLDVEGVGTVRASDIRPAADFEVVNPDLYLATIDSEDGRLSVEFNVEQDKGYRPASQGYRPGDQTEGQPIGVIPLDAIFTPVRKVNYSIESINVGQLSYERLILDIWTDGTLSPVEAVIVICCSLPVPLSTALTFKMPFASISKVTSICGIPRGAGAIPSRIKRPRVLLSAAIGLSPCRT